MNIKTIEVKLREDQIKVIKEKHAGIPFLENADIELLLYMIIHEFVVGVEHETAKSNS